MASGVFLLSPPGLPAIIRRDAAASNWERKRRIYQNSRLVVGVLLATTAKRVRESILMPGVVQLRVFHNGVDLSVFKPGNKAAARDQLAWPQDAFVVIFAANCARHNM